MGDSEEKEEGEGIVVHFFAHLVVFSEGQTILSGSWKWKKIIILSILLYMYIIASGHIIICTH